MIVFMGVAGSGKSVQGKLLAEKLGYTWLSTGELLRNKISGKRRQEMLEGKLLNDSEMIELMEEALSTKESSKIILDGFPRTRPQSDWLIQRHLSGDFAVDAVIHISASEDLVRERLLQRGRQDDNEDAISQRFDEYRELTLPIVEGLKSSGVPVCEVNGEQTVEQVHSEVLNKVNQYLR